MPHDRIVTGGDIAPDDLGSTQTHEHLIVGVAKQLPANATIEFLQRDQEPIRLDTYYYARRRRTSRHSRLTGIDDAIDEITRSCAAGGTSVVDARPRGLGRKPTALQRILRRSGGQVIMGSGYYLATHHPAHVATMSTTQIADEIIADLTDGVDASKPA